MHASPSENRASITVRRAGEWIGGFARARMDDLDTTGLCLGLFGVSCVARALPPDQWPPAFTELTESILNKLVSDSDSPHGLRIQFSSGGFASPLMAAAALVVDTPSATEYRNICLREWKMLEEGRSLEDSQTALWMGQHFATLIGSREEIRPLADSDALRSVNRIWQYTAASHDIQRIVRYLAACSAFGQVKLRLSSAKRKLLTEVIQFWTFFYIKEGDLDMVCPLVRALGYLRHQFLPEYAEGINFILQQSKSNGRFGMQEMATHLRSILADGPVDSDREIYLPLTTASLWALLESDCFDASPFGPIGEHDDKSEGRVR